MKIHALRLKTSSKFIAVASSYGMFYFGSAALNSPYPITTFLHVLGFVSKYFGIVACIYWSFFLAISLIARLLDISDLNIDRWVSWQFHKRSKLYRKIRSLPIDKMQISWTNCYDFPDPDFHWYLETPFGLFDFYPPEVLEEMFGDTYHAHRRAYLLGEDFQSVWFAFLMSKPTTEQLFKLLEKHEPKDAFTVNT